MNKKLLIILLSLGTIASQIQTNDPSIDWNTIKSEIMPSMLGAALIVEGITTLPVLVDKIRNKKIFQKKPWYVNVPVNITAAGVCILGSWLCCSHGWNLFSIDGCKKAFDSNTFGHMSYWPTAILLSLYAGGKIIYQSEDIGKTYRSIFDNYFMKILTKYSVKKLLK